MNESLKKVEFLVVDTTAFIQNAPLQEIASNIITCQDVVNEITNERQLRRLVVLPYELQIKNVHPENVKLVTDFAKKTGDYPSLSATDIKVIALTYQLEKEKVGIDHLRTEPLYQRTINVVTHKKTDEAVPNIAGFFVPKKGIEDVELDTLKEKFESLNSELKERDSIEDILVKCDNDESEIITSEDENDDDSGWITPSNVKEAKKRMQAEEIEEKHVKVACMTTDFAMQNVLKQFNLNVSALDGRIIKQLRTFILRCYTCFKTTSVMTKQFCPKCGNNTLKKVSVSLDENGKMKIHINGRKPLTTRGKKFSIPLIKGGKHPNNPILVADQPMPDNRPSKLARMKNNPLDDDYIAGFSPFVMRDVNSRSAQLHIKPGQGMKHWMQRNEIRRKRK